MESGSARVLIVEDETLIAMAIEDTLSDAGYVVSGSVRTGEEAIRAVLEDAPALVLLDVTLASKMDGLAVGAELRKFWKGPILFHTAYSDGFVRSRIAALTNSFFLPKPSRPNEMIRAVEIALDGHLRK